MFISLCLASHATAFHIINESRDFERSLYPYFGKLCDSVNLFYHCRRQHENSCFFIEKCRLQHCWSEQDHERHEVLLIRIFNLVCIFIITVGWLRRPYLTQVGIRSVHTTDKVLYRYFNLDKMAEKSSDMNMI